MGFLDVLLGKRKLAGPAPDRLFAISTAYVKFETELGIRSRGSAGIVFQPLSSADFQSIVTEMEAVVRGTASDSGVTVDTSDDSYGFRWLVLHGKDFDDLVVGINAVSGSLEAGGYGDRVLCAVFGFEDQQHRPLYWIYNYKRGSFYPFAPAVGAGGASAAGGRGAGGADGPGGEDGQRDNERELVAKAQVGDELPVEQELERWFPLWGIPI